MANFDGHLTAGGLSTSVFTFAASSAHDFGFSELTNLWLLGFLGSVAPDVDSDNSTTLGIVFTLISSILSIVTAFYLQVIGSSPFYVLIGMSVAYLVTRYGVYRVFAWSTRHRGLYHSILAGVFISLAITLAIALYVKGGRVFALFCGTAFFVGFLTHLVVDEWNAIDFQERRLKRSFGSALKLFSLKNWVGSIALGLMSGWMFWELQSIYHQIL